MRAAISLVVFTVVLVASAVVSAQGAPLRTSSGGGGLTTSGADALYLRLDAANDPVTDNLTITVDEVGTTDLWVGPTNHSPSPGANAGGRVRLGRGNVGTSCVDYMANSTGLVNAWVGACLQGDGKFMTAPSRSASGPEMGFGDLGKDWILSVNPSNAEVRFWDAATTEAIYLTVNEDGANGALLESTDAMTLVANDITFQEPGAGDYATFSPGSATLNHVNPDGDSLYSLGSSSAARWKFLRLNSGPCGALPTCDSSMYGALAVCDLNESGKDSQFVVCLSEAGGGDEWTGFGVGDVAVSPL